MIRFVKVGTRADLPQLDSGKLAEAEGRSIALFSVGGSYYALDNTCPHRGGPLSDGTLMGHEVSCPWHGSRFDVKTGAVLFPPAQEGVRSYPVRIAGDEVEIGIE